VKRSLVWLVVAVAGLGLSAGPAQGSPLTPLARPAPPRCPIAAGAPTAHPVPTATPPTHDPARPVIGGEALGTPGVVLPGGAPPLPANLTATSWLVADLDTGAVLGACGAHEYRAPASVQKLLLAATLMPQLDPATVVQVVPADLQFEPGSSAVGLLVGGRYPVATLWLGLLLNSGNDAANVLARLGGGPRGVAGTLEAMNATARELGAYDTHAVTPSGLDGPGQYTSAYDLALIARACFEREDFRRYATTPRAQIPAQPPMDPRGFQIQNENRLLSQYPGALGGKTGYTSQARHTYVGAAQRGGRRLVVTLLGAEAQPARGWQQGAALLDWGFAVPPEASVGRLVAPGEADVLMSSPTPGGASGSPPAGTPARLGDAADAGWWALLREAAQTGGPALPVAGGAVVGTVLVVLLAGARQRRRHRRRALDGTHRALDGTHRAARRP
jgi:D-alanyl-D-alanine carboxypeptidase (penicillin-binding protein 5/6)